MEGKIGGDSLLSPRGMKYAEALPALIKENIGDAPLTVYLNSLNFFIAKTQSGVDLDSSKNYTDRVDGQLPKADLEIVR